MGLVIVIVKHGNRKLEFTPEELGIALAIAGVLGNDDIALNVVERWLNGEDTVELDTDSFIEFLILKGMGSGGVKLER